MYADSIFLIPSGGHDGGTCKIERTTSKNLSALLLMRRPATVPYLIDPSS